VDSPFGAYAERERARHAGRFVARRMDVNMQATAASANDLATINAKIDTLRQEAAAAFAKVQEVVNGQGSDMQVIASAVERLDGETLTQHEDEIELRRMVEELQKDVQKHEVTINDAGLNDFVLKTKLDHVTGRIEQAFGDIEKVVGTMCTDKAEFDAKVVESGANLKAEVDVLAARVAKTEVSCDMAKQFIGKTAGRDVVATPSAGAASSSCSSLRGLQEFDQLEGLYLTMETGMVKMTKDVEQIMQAIEHLQQAATAPGQDQSTAPKVDDSGCHCPHVTTLCIEMAALTARVDGMAGRGVSPPPGMPGQETRGPVHAGSTPEAHDGWGHYLAARAQATASAPATAPACGQTGNVAQAQGPTHSQWEQAPQAPVPGQVPGGEWWNGPQRSYGGNNRSIYADSKVYDEKMAQSDLYKYDGKPGTGDIWKVRMRNYLTSKLPSLKPILAFSENMGDVPIDEARLWHEAGTQGWRLDAEIGVMSGHVWSFLNSVLDDRAFTTF